ncbi:aldehyde dehydrogenase family protein [Thalassotalea ponticola]|uniref:aldehyde dehydrogenase family protein n=1 Tax=Thalassotalea ponticola TaxID=1523392 RepID=UPI0025B47B6F|nr:aldehyde dehydrogenase family protein [Thalassotalea ponticola]MDN3653897.1 aldehyde dehydrogenase family protein [Thalassotalea ponticola]
MTYQQQLEQQKAYFQQGTTRNIAWRKQQLTQIKKLVNDNEQAIIAALKADLGKPSQEAWITEISYITNEVDHALSKLKSWLKPQKVHTPLLAQPGQSAIKAEPYGSVLIIGAWNYPFQLVFAPLVAVIAAGNCAVLKPSELAPNISALVAKLVPEYLDTEAIHVVEGGVEQTSALLELAWDHIMYTGNGQVGRIVMTAAAKHLTPVTLELGGKSPVFVDRSADLTITCQRLAWGKWMNAGQTCIAPDYILTTADMVMPLINELVLQIKAMFGEDAKQSDSYGRIINERHCQRLQQYLMDQDVAFGGSVDVSQRYIEPTIVIDPDVTSSLMTEEIFGPILPIISIDSFAQAKQFIINRDKPLAAYLFSKEKTQHSDWVEQISAGSQCINDVMMFNAVTELPFGGVGPSGMGRYSGKHGFDNFSHFKAVLKRPFIKDVALRFAPYTAFKLALLRKLR